MRFVLSFWLAVVIVLSTLVGASAYTDPYLESAYAYEQYASPWNYGFGGVGTDSYYVRDRDAIVYRATSPDYGFGSASQYYYMPLRPTRWTCVGNGCGKTPYVRPYDTDCRYGRHYDEAYFDNRYGRYEDRSYDYPYYHSGYRTDCGHNTYTRGVYQPW